MPPPATAELGVTDLNTDAFAIVPEGSTMPLYTGGQGGSHIYATLRTTGFPTGVNGNADIQLAQTAMRASNGDVLHDFSQLVAFEPIGNGVFELKSRFVFLDDLPENLDGQSLRVVFVATSSIEPAVSASIERTVNLALQP